MRDRRDTQKKRFIETLAEEGTVSCAAKAAGVSRNTAYRWRQDDREFASQWDEAMETAIDAVESTLYQKAKSGETIPMIFYLKNNRARYSDRLTINIPQVHNEIEARFDLIKQTLQPADRKAEVTIKDVLKPMIFNTGRS